jgi:hypothetical protein
LSFCILLLLGSGLSFGGANVTLLWDPSPTEDLVTAYHVYWARVGSTNWTRLATTTNCTWLITGLTNATQFYVTAVNLLGEGAQPSNIAIAPASLPGVVNNHRAVVVIVP